MHTDLLDYQEGETALQAYVAYDDSTTEKRPAILIAHDWRGRGDFTNQKAQDMAKLGYVGFALDLYGKGIFGKNNQENEKLLQPLLDDRALLLRRLEAALETVKQLDCVDTSRIAIMGYCLGGLSALDLARSGADIKGAVSLHGVFMPPDLPKHKIKAKVLALHGHDDPVCQPEMEHALAKELSEAECDWQLHIFGNTKHSFTNPEANDEELGLIYSASADNRSTKLIKEFYQEIF